LRKSTLNTAANLAAHRRSQITGKLRKLSENKLSSLSLPKKYTKDDLGFLFGGSAKPKLATEKVNVRKEKEKALAWVKDEIKKYDQQQMLEDVEMHMQSIAMTVRREQKDTI
jgi:hypothetical protein